MKKSLIALFILQLTLSALASEVKIKKQHQEQKKLRIAARGIATTMKKAKKEIKLLNERIEISVK